MERTARSECGEVMSFQEFENGLSGKHLRQSIEEWTK